jgi:hypothetical protein
MIVTVASGSFLRQCGGHRRRPREERVEAFRHGRVRENGIAQRGIGKAGDHCDLHGGHDFPGADAQCGEAQDAIAARVDQRFHESAYLHERTRAQHRRHWGFEQAVCDALCLCFCLAETYARELRVCEEAKRNLAAGGQVIAAGDIVVHDAKIVFADVGELGTARHFANGPDAGRAGLEPLIDLDISTRRQLHACGLQAESFRIGNATGSHQQMRAFEHSLGSMLLDHNFHRLP